MHDKRLFALFPNGTRPSPPTSSPRELRLPALPSQGGHCERRSSCSLPPDSHAALAWPHSLIWPLRNRQGPDVRVFTHTRRR